MKLKTYGLATVFGFEFNEPVDPFVGWAKPIWVVKSVHEGVDIGIVFGRFWYGDDVWGILVLDLALVLISCYSPLTFLIFY